MWAEGGLRSHSGGGITDFLAVWWEDVGDANCREKRGVLWEAQCETISRMRGIFHLTREDACGNVISRVVAENCRVT